MVPLQDRCIVPSFWLNESIAVTCDSFTLLYVNIHGQAYVDVPQDRLDGLVVHAQRVKVCREAAPESVPAVPGKRLVQLRTCALPVCDPPRASGT